MGVWMLVGVSAIIGGIGVLSVTALTGITLASNIGTFVLYALICIFTFVTFVGTKDFHALKHAVVPFLGLIGNVGLLIAIVFIGLTTPGVSQDATKMALWVTVVWGLLSVGYLVLKSRKTGKYEICYGIHTTDERRFHAPRRDHGCALRHRNRGRCTGCAYAY